MRLAALWAYGLHECCHAHIERPTEQGDSIECRYLTGTWFFFGVERPVFIPEKTIGGRAKKRCGLERREESVANIRRPIEKCFQIENTDINKTIERPYRSKLRELVDRGNRARDERRDPKRERRDDQEECEYSHAQREPQMILWRKIIR